MVLSHSFSVDQISFVVRLLITSFVVLWPKSSRVKCKSFIFFSSISFPFGSHSLALLVQVKPIRTAALTRYIAAAIWLHVSPMPVIHVQWQVLIFAVFLSTIICGMDPLWTEIFYILLWWYSIYFLKGYDIAKIEAILIYSNYMLYCSYSP